MQRRRGRTATFIIFAGLALLSVVAESAFGRGVCVGCNQGRRSVPRPRSDGSPVFGDSSNFAGLPHGTAEALRQAGIGGGGVGYGAALGAQAPMAIQIFSQDRRINPDVLWAKVKAINQSTDDNAFNKSVSDLWKEIQTSPTSKLQDSYTGANDPKFRKDLCLVAPSEAAAAGAKPPTDAATPVDGAEGEPIAPVKKGGTDAASTSDARSVVAGTTAGDHDLIAPVRSRRLFVEGDYIAPPIRRSPAAPPIDMCAEGPNFPPFPQNFNQGDQDQALNPNNSGDSTGGSPEESNTPGNLPSGGGQYSSKNKGVEAPPPSKVGEVSPFQNPGQVDGTCTYCRQIAGVVPGFTPDGTIVQKIGKSAEDFKALVGSMQTPFALPQRNSRPSGPTTFDQLAARSTGATNRKNGIQSVQATKNNTPIR